MKDIFFDKIYRNITIENDKQMKLKEFLDLLKAQPAAELVFEYSPGALVPASFHITEVKNVHVESVDCGGRPDSYDQTIVQLWVQDGEQKEKGMSAEKALKIFDIVHKAKPMQLETPLFFEWGHGELRTSVYEVQDVESRADRIHFKMFVPPTVCKPKLELATNCQPGGGCC